jgi:hypothetical protein
VKRSTVFFRNTKWRSAPTVSAIQEVHNMDLFIQCPILCYPNIGLSNSLYFLSHFFIGHAHHRDVCDLRMHNQALGYTESIMT